VHCNESSRTEDPAQDFKCFDVAGSFAFELRRPTLVVFGAMRVRATVFRAQTRRQQVSGQVRQFLKLSTFKDDSMTTKSTSLVGAMATASVYSRTADAPASPPVVAAPVDLPKRRRSPDMNEIFPNYGKFLSDMISQEFRNLGMIDSHSQVPAAFGVKHAKTPSQEARYRAAVGDSKYLSPEVFDTLDAPIKYGIVHELQVLYIRRNSNDDYPENLTFEQAQRRVQQLDYDLHML
jgi:hypothetical protein